MDIKEAVAESVLGLLSPERLPGICTRALVDGLDSPSLAALAGESISTLDPVEARQLFVKAIRELRIVTPSPREAARFLIERACAAALTGDRDPYSALSRIVKDIYLAHEHEWQDHEYVGDHLGIQQLVGLYYDYDDLHEPFACTREELDQASLQALQAYLNSRAA